MAPSLGSSAAFVSPGRPSPAAGQGPVFVAAKKKGCKEKKCSNWKGGKCRCGRD